MPTENRTFIDPESRLGLNLYAKLFGSVTVPHSTGTINGTSLGNGYYQFAGLDNALDYTVYEEAVAGTKAATDEWLSVLGADFAAIAATQATAAATAAGQIPRLATAIAAGADFELNAVLDTASKLTANLTPRIP